MENYSTTMEARHGGGSFFNLDTDDDFLFLDPNLPPLDSIASDFSAFLDSTGPSGSLLPADEWSGTSNTLPDTPSSQQLQHALEGSSPLQSQSQPVIQGKQQQQQQFVFESHVPGASSQAEVLGNQQNAIAGVEQMDADHPQTRASSMQSVENQRHPTYPNRPLMLNVSSAQQQSLPQAAAAATTPREMLLQSSGFQTQDASFGHQSQRNFENLQGRQLSASSIPGFQGQMENGLRMSLPRGLMGMTGSNAQQISIQGQQVGIGGHLQSSDGDGSGGVGIQSQLMNSQANFSGHANALQQSQYGAKANARQAILPGHAMSFQLQPQSHQLQQMQVQSKLHPQVMANQVMNQGLLQSRLGSQQPSYQMLQQQGFQMHPNTGANHLPFGRQMFPQMQPRLQNQLLQGLRFGSPLGARQHGQQQIVGPQIASGAPEMARYPPGTNATKCAQLLTHYIQDQRKRPADNSINFWVEFVRRYFAHGATKRWCLTSYSTTSVGRHAQGLFPMDYWYCNLCGVQPGRGFESGTDVLPRLFKIKYDSGLLDELLFLDVATEKQSLPSGKVVLEYSRAVHESVFPELRVIRQGKLRVTFNNSFKICSWEFCTKAHEEVVPRKNLLQQVHQLASLVIESDQEIFDKSAENLKNHCNAFTKAAKQLAVQLDAPMVNDLGFSKRYVRCLQIAEVVNSMKDLISYERKTGLGPIESLARFPTVKKLQMEGAMSGLPPSLSLTQMINELTQGPSSLQSSTVTRLQSESMSEAQEAAVNQAQSSVFKGMDSSQQRNPMDARLQHLLQQSETYNQIQPSQAQSGQVQSHSMNQISQLTSQAQPQPHPQPVASQAPASHQTTIKSGAPQQQQQQNYQQSVLKSAAAKSSLSQPQSVNQTSLPGTPQSEMSDMRTNT